MQSLLGIRATRQIRVNSVTLKRKNEKTENRENKNWDSFCNQFKKEAIFDNCAFFSNSIKTEEAKLVFGKNQVIFWALTFTSD